MDELPIYKVSIDPELQQGENELGMDEIAFTSDPAILVKGVAFKNQKNKQHFADNLKYRITAPAMIPMEIYRADEDGEYFVEFDENTIEDIHVKFMSNLENNNLFNVEHNSSDRAPAYILEAWIVDNPQQDKAFSTFGIEVPKGTLMLTAQVTDKDFYNSIVESERFGFSIEAFLALQIPKEQESKLSSQTSKQSNNNNMELPNGKFTAEDGTTYENLDGVWTKVELSEEEVELKEETVDSESVEAPVVAVEEAEVTMESDDEEKEEEMAEEVPEEEKEEEMAVDPELDAEAVLAIVNPRLEEFMSEVLQVIAEMKEEMGESGEESPAEDAEVNMSVAQKLEKLSKYWTE